jgi:hypothetical protein
MDVLGGMAPEPIDFTNSKSDEATYLALEFISLNGTAAPE